MLFDDAILEYIEEKANGRTKVRSNTLEGYLSTIKLYLVPQWAGREIESITCDEMQAWVDSIEKPGAACKAFNTFRQMYRRYLREYQVRIWDETQAVVTPKKPRKKPKALTLDETREAAREMQGEDFEACALVQMTNGLRPCEAIALTWDDIDLDEKTVSVNKGLHEAFGVVYESPTKTEKSTRSVVLTDETARRLSAIRSERKPKPTDRLCNLTPSQYRKRVRQWFHARNVKMCAQHLRHTYGTLALQSGVPLETVALMLGHASVRTTYRCYLVGNITLYREAQNKVSAMLALAG